MKLTDREKIQCVKLYQKGLSYKTISKKFNVGTSSIRRLILNRGIISRKFKGQIHHFYDTTFDIIDTEEKAYWIGFIFGDGSVISTSLSLELSNKDINHLKKLNKFLKADRKVKLTRKNCSLISFNSRYLVNALSKHNIIPNKTYKDVRTPKTIPKNLLKHFYRGILDADGWITKHKSKKRNICQHEFGFSSYNLEFLKEIKKWIQNELNIKYGYLIERKRKNQRVCQLIFGGNTNFKNIYNILYKDSTIYLDRKYEKATEFLKYIKSNY